MSLSLILQTHSHSIIAGTEQTTQWKTYTVCYCQLKFTYTFCYKRSLWIWWISHCTSLFVSIKILDQLPSLCPVVIGTPCNIQVNVLKKSLAMTSWSCIQIDRVGQNSSDERNSIPFVELSTTRLNAYGRSLFLKKLLYHRSFKDAFIHLLHATQFPANQRQTRNKI